MGAVRSVADTPENLARRKALWERKIPSSAEGVEHARLSVEPDRRDAAARYLKAIGWLKEPLPAADGEEGF